MQKSPSRKPSFHSEGVEKIYPDHANDFRKAGLARPISLTMRKLWKNQDEKMNIENKKEPDVKKKKNRNIYFCVAYSRYFYTSTHRAINKLKQYFNLSWMRVRMSYHIFNNLSELINGDIATKIGWGILS